jgi:hypothetical protein
VVPRREIRLVLRQVSALLLVTLLVPAAAQAQAFGRNKVHYDDLDFEVLETPHFEIYCYRSEHDASVQAARMAERWYARLSLTLGHTFTQRQPML